MARMPAFGLDGPWRDHVGFAQTMEQMTGMAWVTGHEYDQPRIPRGPCDPLAGMHSAFAMLVGLSRRAQTGHGSLMRCRWSRRHQTPPLSRPSSSPRTAPYCRDWAIGVGTRRLRVCTHVAVTSSGWLLSVASDGQWVALKTVLGQPAWADHPSLDTHEGRWRAHDLIDKHLERWSLAKTASTQRRCCRLLAVPASPLYDARLSPRHPQMVARGYFEHLDHSIVGRTRSRPFHSGSAASIGGVGPRHPPSESTTRPS